jgi:acetylornithine deacetylase/succinyl-diaminopimelate desuccinylase-like protein
MGAMTKSYTPEAEVVQICRDLIRIDTSNYGDESGPGERAAAELVAGLLDEVGIESRLFEPSPGRTSLVAHWGDPNAEDRLLLHGHLDVVPAARADWKVDPFSAEEVDGYIWGRGAVDMKDFDATILSVVRARARAGALPERSITMAFTADEEAGSLHGAHPLADQHPDWFEGCTEGIGEVGGFSATIRASRGFDYGLTARPAMVRCAIRTTPSPLWRRPSRPSAATSGRSGSPRRWRGSSRRWRP